MCLYQQHIAFTHRLINGKFHSLRLWSTTYSTVEKPTDQVEFVIVAQNVHLELVLIGQLEKREKRGNKIYGMIAKIICDHIICVYYIKCDVCTHSRMNSVIDTIKMSNRYHDSHALSRASWVHDRCNWCAAQIVSLNNISERISTFVCVRVWICWFTQWP